MKITCTECKQKSEDGILEHLETCTANLFKPTISTDYLRPLAQAIEFESKEEQDKFYPGLSGGSGGYAPTHTTKSPTKEKKVK